MIGIWGIAGTLFLASCERSTENNAGMKMPLERTGVPGGRSHNNFTDTTARVKAGEKISK